jgi:hypothetical protein
VFAFLTLTVLAFVLWRMGRAGDVAPVRVATMAGWIVGVLLLACTVTTLTGVLIMRLVGFYQAAAHEKLFSWHGILVGAALVLSGGGIVLHKGNARELASAAMLLWALGLGAAAVFATSVSAELEWPLLFALLGSAPWLVGIGGEKPRWLALTYFGFLPAVVMGSRVIYAVIVATGTTAPAAPVLFFVLLAFLLAPVWARLGSTWLFRTGVLLGSLSILIGIGGIALARWWSTEPVSDSLVYAVDADSGTAQWVTLDKDIDPWIKSLVRNDWVPSSWPTFSRSPAPVLQASAPLLPLIGPEIELVAQRRDSNGRVLSLRIRAADDARCVRLWLDGGPAILETRIDGRPLQSVVRFSPEADERLFRMVSGDRSKPGWHMEHCAVAGGALNLLLTTAGSEPLRLHVVEEIDGLPSQLMPGPTRPKGFVPSQESDTTLIGRAFVR